MSTLTNAFRINGVIDTNKSVLSNLNVICKAAGCWLSYDSTTGLWSVIINKPGSSVKSFNDSNIIGSISITGSGVDQLYNSVEVQFPHVDLLNTIDYANFELANSARYPNELDKKLTISLDCINNPVQAQYIGAVELGQNRADKIIQFKTDFSSIGLKAGDLIDVTSAMYGYNAKVFRVIKIAEEDPDDGTIQLSITALEYDEGIYSANNLIYNARTTATGVVPKSMNSAVTGLDKASQTNLVYSFKTGQISLTGVDHSTTDVNFFGLFGAPESMYYYNLGYSFQLPYSGTYKVTYNVNWGSAFNVNNQDNIGLPPTIRKNSNLVIYKNNVQSILTGTSAVKGDDPNTDALMEATFTGVKGDNIAFWAGFATDLTQNSPDTVAGTNTTRSTAEVSSSLFYLGA